MVKLKVTGPKEANPNDLRRNREPLAHTLLTSNDADLAEVADRWESLPPEIKAEVLRLIRQS
jgi:hypothetical protein